MKYNLHKRCNKCKTYKSLDEFHKHVKSKDGYKYSCKLCRKEENKIRYLKHKIHIKNKVFLYQLKNKNKIQILKKKYKQENPWSSIFARIRQRCTNSKKDNYHRYGGRGIECRITSKELKQLWFRDKAYEMKRPSIDRIDNDGHYEFTNYRFIELSENSKKQFIDRKLKEKENIK